MQDRGRIRCLLARTPGARRLAALATMSAVAALVAVALVGGGGASANVEFGGLANGSRSLTAGPPGLPALSARGEAGSAAAQLPGAPPSSVPSPGHDSVLAAVACPKPSDCWAVGDFDNSGGASVNEALRWNGKKWSEVKTPNPGGTASDDLSELSGVTCVSASDCWAVGESERGSSAPGVNEALRFNGKKWSKVKTPNPGGTASGDHSELEGVTCVSASGCWAIGDSERSGAGDVNEALRFNGKKWSKVKTPDPVGNASTEFNELRGLTCVSASDCWAVGVYGDAGAMFNEALHWGGKKWSYVTTPQPSTRPSEFLNPLESVVCVKASDCWAVGYYINHQETALLNDAMHWNGRKWLHVRTPQPGGRNNEGINALLGVGCSSRSDCRAVGTAGSFKTMESLSNEALRFNGKKWSSG